MEIFDYLKIMIEKDASDLYLTTDAPPIIKVQGTHNPIHDTKFERGEVKKIAYGLMSEEKQQIFEKNWEMNMALSAKDLGRFRINIFMQRNEVAMVFRAIKMTIPQPEDLGLPSILKDEVMKKSGLIIFVGATGTGKSTSLASLMQYRAEREAGHIITIEDPIEFLHPHAKAIFNQREIGIDTLSYKDALENAMRQAPDVILVGEIRDKNTMEHAMTFAETGHLCLATLHAHNSSQAIERIINFFPQDQHPQLLLDLSLYLNAIISQRLLKSKHENRIAAFEMMLASPLIRDLIKRGEIDSLREIMQRSESMGMQTFDTALFNLFKSGLIEEDEALRHADAPNNLRLRINLDRGIEVDDDSFSIKAEKPEEEASFLRRTKENHADN